MSPSAPRLGPLFLFRRIRVQAPVTHCTSTSASSPSTLGSVSHHRHWSRRLRLDQCQLDLRLLAQGAAEADPPQEGQVVYIFATTRWRPASQERGLASPTLVSARSPAPGPAWQRSAARGCVVFGYYMRKCWPPAPVPRSRNFMRRQRYR